jgi:hypothetical protein
MRRRRRRGRKLGWLLRSCIFYYTSSYIIY